MPAAGEPAAGTRERGMGPPGRSSGAGRDSSRARAGLPLMHTAVDLRLGDEWGEGEDGPRGRNRSGRRS